MKEFINQIANHSSVLIFVLAVIIVLLVLMFLAKKMIQRIMETQEQWREERRFYKAISMSPSQVHLMVQADDLRPIYISDGIETLLGLDKQDVAVDVAVIFRAMEEEERADIKKALYAWDQEAPLVLEFASVNYRTKQRGFMKLRIEKSLEEDAFLVMLIDITSQKKRELQLVDELNLARQENQAKTEFLSKMSHEIRTPMNGIIGMLELSKMELQNPKAVEGYLDKAQNLSQFLLTLINDILDLSRIESGKTELECERFDIFAMAEKLRSMFQKTIEEKGVKFTLEMKDFDVHYLMGDELRLNQVIINFISNAIKFTDKGGSITITFRQMQHKGRDVRLMIRVRDTGKGIEPDFLNKIFRPFEQESTKITKKYGGSGLGMAIADNIIRLMGGQIVIDSEVGKGSDFTVFLSLEAALEEDENDRRQKENSDWIQREKARWQKKELRELIQRKETDAEVENKTTIQAEQGTT